MARDGSGQAAEAMPSPPPVDLEKEIAKYDPEMRFRELRGAWRSVAFAVGAGMSVFQLYTAGAGLLNAHVQRAVHLAFILALTFLL